MSTAAGPDGDWQNEVGGPGAELIANPKQKNSIGKTAQFGWSSSLDGAEHAAETQQALTTWQGLPGQG